MEEQSKFEGWAKVEVMGHQRHLGYCETVTFGSTVMLKVTDPEIPAFERTLEVPEWMMGGELLAAGSRIRQSRPKKEVFLGLGSIFRLTPCPEADTIDRNTLVTEVLHRAQAAALPAASDDFDELSHSECVKGGDGEETSYF